LLGAGIVAAIVVGCGLGGGPAQSPPPIPADPLPTLDPSEVEIGQKVYLQTCLVCHRPNGAGAPNWTKPDARGNLPPPPHDDSGHTWRHGDADLADIIRNGQRDVFNQTPELTMPAFKGQLSDDEIAAVIAYVKSLWTPEHRRFQEEQSRRPAMPMATPGGAR